MSDEIQIVADGGKIALCIHPSLLTLLEAPNETLIPVVSLTPAAAFEIGNRLVELAIIEAQKTINPNDL